MVAQWGKGPGRKFIDKHSPHFYALGLAVYATAWTFYGSIGRAATYGLDFLAVYLGPMIIMPLWWYVTKKMVRISKAQHLNSISDFITARYGKSWFLGAVVTLLLVLAITPYLALQIKAISSSANVLLGDSTLPKIDLDLASTLLLLVFTLIYGLRFAFGERQRYGLIAAIAFESTLKLVGTFIAGFIIVHGMLGGSAEIFKRSIDAGMKELLIVQDPTNWWMMMIISAFAFIMLPRQFQMAVVSNRRERDIRKAMWLLPIYLLLMNWWVVPIALGGNLTLDNSVSADYHFLRLAMSSGNDWLPAMVFVGGLAACTSMIIVSSSALGAMVSSNLIIPATLKRDGTPRFQLNPLNTRRIALVLIFALAYGYYTRFVQKEALVSIGIISFIGISQLAPGFLGALFWRRGTSQGVLTGLIAGFSVWFLAFMLPYWIPNLELINQMFRLFPQWSPMSNIVFLSLFLNSFLMVGISLISTQGIIDRSQAEIFFNIMQIPRRRYDQSPVTKGKITFDRMEKMLHKFIPDELLSETIYKRYTIDRIQADPFREVPHHLVSYAERLLTQIIGPAAARIVLSREIEADTLNPFDIQDIIEETKETQRLNTQLQDKTERLAALTQKLTEMGKLKDDFLYSVTHELRSPLTAIRAQIEIIRDDAQMPLEVREQFLDATISETERLTHLISNVLDIEKFESGNQQLEFEQVDLTELISQTLEMHKALATSEGIELNFTGANETYVHADRARIQQVFINLLSNAIKYGKSRIDITINDCEEYSWCVAVRDDGDGVPEKDTKYLFEKFYQATDQTVKKRVGSGLGLAISYNIIKAHGGTLELKSNPPQGPTSFAFTLKKHSES
jgi:signal transduction histidine kinase